MVLALVLAIVPRRTIWGLQLRPAVPGHEIPPGPILLVARVVRGANMEVTPVLADWQARGVIEVERLGPDLPAEPRVPASSGPEWRFSVRDASSLDDVELLVLAAFVGGNPATGATFLLSREDAATRDAIWSAVRNAIDRQRASFGAKSRVRTLAAVGLISLAALGGAASLIGSVVGGAGPAAIAVAFLSAVVGMVLVPLVCGGARCPTDAERRYRQGIRDLEPWVRSTAPPS